MGVDLAQNVEQAQRQLPVQVAGGFVGQQQSRPADHGPGDGHPLLFAAGQHPAGPSGLAVQA